MRTILSVAAVLCGVIAILFGLACWAVPAGAQEHSHEGEVGRFYETWTMPNNRFVSCCNRLDCESVDHVRWFNGLLQMQRRRDGQWLTIPREKLEQNQGDARDSPDGFSHMCSGGDNVYCAVLGTGM